MARRTLASLSLLAFLGLPGEAADKEPPSFSAEVSLVSLPVFVSDRKGRAWPGLAAEDFELYDDGKKVPVVAFQYVDTTSAEDQELIRQAPAARRRFFLLFDLSFADPAGLHRAQQAAREFVRRRLAPSDLVAVATVDANRGVRILANFTEDRRLLTGALDTLGLTARTPLTDPLALTSILATDVAPVGARGANLEQAAADALRVFARQLRMVEDRAYRQDVATLISGLQDLGQALRNVEGRKQVLYFSAGFDSRALMGVTGAEMRQDSEAIAAGRLWEVDGLTRYGDTRLRTLFSEMAETLAGADCVVHSVDVLGLAGEDRLQQVGVSQDAARQHPGRDSLLFVASETGGRLFKDANDLAAVLGEVADMTSRYYVLGYQPEDLKKPGQYHKLKVKVRRKGAKVSHRGGFYERVPVRSQPVLQRQFEAAQLVMTGAGPNTLRFSALCLPFPVAGPLQSLGVVVQVPRDQVRWSETLGLEVYGYAVAEDGSVADHLAQVAQIEPARADPDGTARGVSFYGTLQVPAGRYTLKLMVSDKETGESGVHFLDVSVPPHDPRVGFLLPPVVVEQDGRWVEVALDRARRGAEFPFSIGGRAFLPRSSFEVRPGAAETLVLIAYDSERPADPVSGLEIRSSLTDSKGHAASPGLIRIDRVHKEEGGRRAYVLRYEPEDLAPGDYTLRIGISEGGSLMESYSLVRVARDRSSMREARPGVPTPAGR